MSLVTTECMFDTATKPITFHVCNNATHTMLTMYVGQHGLMIQKLD